MSDGEGIRYNDRVFVVGPTGSGKSTVANALAGHVQTQVLHYDTKDEWAIDDVEPVTRVGALDWRERVLLFRGDGGPDEAQELFGAAWRPGRPLVVVVHELADLCDDKPNLTIPAFQHYVRKGRAHGLGLIGASQRPVSMPKISRTEAQHVFYVIPRLDTEDHDIVVKMCQGVPRAQVEEMLAKAEAGSPTGEHGFVWYDKRARSLRWSPPLDAAVLRRLTIRKTTLA